ncbi:LOW QUALITY PROTEIN: deoxyribonuclease TATDN1-like [Lepeophtheirus salmonis]|uniref:LOW QUALITY PROTEIN: deoxyribonuclease TATDN1-like n=1 Tax=Lepeophtheirus salmonis TaxID=72036 RepID=UPI001AE5ACCB|nr:LOW QUALITY PROTEIN: putative deoxyribonuclease TATDN1 [Lepeophtheirus salmonis]
MKRYRFIDIGANLTDLMYEGFYNGSNKHSPDLNTVIERSFTLGNLSKMILTAGNLEDSKKSLELAKKDDRMFSTIGVHPTRCSELKESKDVRGYLNSFSNIVKQNTNKIVALGEFGLDKERTHFCDFETQKKYFDMQLEHFGNNGCDLPLFLHSRNSSKELLEILNRHKSKFTKSGVVHSFDGSLEEANSILDAGYYIGINGCSCKTEENIEVIKELPIDKLMIETDCPWCEVRPSHAGHKYISTRFGDVPTVKKNNWKHGAIIKNRNEPMFIVQVLEIVAGVKGLNPQEVADVIFETTDRVFFQS